MKYANMGRTGMKVSQLCLGTMNFGGYTEEKDAFAIMDRALEAGVNFFDTANVYGGPGNHGRTEEILGRWFAQGGNDGNAWYWPQKYMVTWKMMWTGQTAPADCPPTKSAVIWTHP